MGLYKKGFKTTLKCNSCITGKANSYFNPLGFEVPENLPTKKYEAMLIMKVQMKRRQNVTTRSSLTACSDKCEDALNPEAQIQSQEGYNIGDAKTVSKEQSQKKG